MFRDVLSKVRAEKYVWPGRRNSAWDGKVYRKSDNIYDRHPGALWVALDLCFDHRKGGRSTFHWERAMPWGLVLWCWRRVINEICADLCLYRFSSQAVQLLAKRVHHRPCIEGLKNHKSVVWWPR